MNFAIPGLMPSGRPNAEQQFLTELDGSARLDLYVGLRGAPIPPIALSIKDNKDCYIFSDYTLQRVHREDLTDGANETVYYQFPAGTFACDGVSKGPCRVVVFIGQESPLRFLSQENPQPKLGITIPA